MAEELTNGEIRERFGVTGAQLDEWAAEYESGDWSGMRFGAPAPGRPRMYGEPMETITVKVPRSRIAALRRAAERLGISRSELVRQAIDRELVAV